MQTSKIYTAVMDYNPISLSINGINFLLKKESSEMKVLAVFFSVINSLLGYLARKFAEISLLPHIIAVLSPIECGVLTFTVSFFILSLCFGIISKNQPPQQNMLSG